MRNSLRLMALVLVLLLGACTTSESPPVVITPPPPGSDATPGTAPLGPQQPTEEAAAPTPEAAAGSTPVAPTGATTTQADDMLPATAGRIAFMGPYGQGAMRVFLANADGTGITPIGEEFSNSYYPSLSPDNTQVLLVAPVEQDTADIFVVDVASGKATNLTERAGNDLQPVWSPDSTQIAFVSEREGGNMDLWVMNADGSEPRRVAQTPGVEQMGSWSPDGTQIVLSMKDEIGESLWIVDVASGERTQLTESNAQAQDSAPTWSPNGDMIAFYSGGQTVPPMIYTIAPDGSNRTPQTDGTQVAVLPIWSPDGSYLLYTTTDGQSRYDLNIMEVASKVVRVLPNVQGLAGTWRAAETPLADTGFTQGPATTGVEVDPAVLQDAYKLGEESAPVKIVEFSDYQCPFCQRFFQETMPQLTPLIEAGTVQLIFVDFPLGIHPQAPAAAEAARCAGDQGGTESYFKMHDALFAGLQQWSGNENPAPIFATLAEEAGLDGAALQACVEAGTHTDKVNAGLAEGTRLGVSGTPTFFVNGDRLIGAQPFSAFEPYMP